MKNYSEEIKILLAEYKDKGFEYGKPVSYLEFRNGCSIEEIESEIFNSDEIEFTEKQIKESEIRYKTYFVYTKKTGRVYVITFRQKIRIITVYPIGRSTLKRYSKAKFKR